MATPIPVSAYLLPTVGGSSYLNTNASALVKTGEGYLVGIMVNSTSSGTIKLWDALTATTPVLVNTFTPPAAGWYPMPFHFNTGLYITIGSTLDCTISFT